MAGMPDHPFRALPQVSRVLADPALTGAVITHPPAAVTAAVRAELGALKTLLTAGQTPDVTPAAVAAGAAARLRADAVPHLRPVINATGIVLHTNLGRAPLHETAARAAYDAARGYLNLELDLGTGKRASRQNPVRAGIRRLTGAEAGTAVNNCAAATLLVVRALAAGKEVVVSRGQLVEIGGGFRIPEVMAAGGATLREVGTTNITRLADYERAIGPNTGLLMRVHSSNYRVRGFTKAVPLAELIALGKKHGIPVADDAGSGAAVDLAPFGLPGEPLVSAGIAAGADVVLFSGDKRLGGPQAGIIAGSAGVIRRIEADPFFRAVRLDKMALAALEATLRLYRDPARAVREVPVLRMLSTPVTELRHRAERLAAALTGVDGLEPPEVRDAEGFVGGGSLPDRPLLTVVVALRPAADGGVSVAELARRLRTGTPAVVARVKGGRLLLDPRTVFDWQEDELVAAVRAAVGSAG